MTKIILSYKRNGQSASQNEPPNDNTADKITASLSSVETNSSIYSSNIPATLQEHNTHARLTFPSDAAIQQLSTVAQQTTTMLPFFLTEQQQRHVELDKQQFAPQQLCNNAAATVTIGQFNEHCGYTLQQLPDNAVAAAAPFMDSNNDLLRCRLQSLLLQPQEQQLNTSELTKNDGILTPLTTISGAQLMLDDAQAQFLALNQQQQQQQHYQQQSNSPFFYPQHYHHHHHQSNEEAGGIHGMPSNYTAATLTIPIMVPTFGGNLMLNPGAPPSVHMRRDYQQSSIRAAFDDEQRLSISNGDNALACALQSEQQTRSSSFDLSVAATVAAAMQLPNLLATSTHYSNSDKTGANNILSQTYQNIIEHSTATTTTSTDLLPSLPAVHLLNKSENIVANNNFMPTCMPAPPPHLLVVSSAAAEQNSNNTAAIFDNINRQEGAPWLTTSCSTSLQHTTARSPNMFSMSQDGKRILVLSMNDLGQQQQHQSNNGRSSSSCADKIISEQQQHFNNYMQDALAAGATLIPQQSAPDIHCQPSLVSNTADTLNIGHQQQQNGLQCEYSPYLLNHWTSSANHMLGRLPYSEHCVSYDAHNTIPNHTFQQCVDASVDIIPMPAHLHGIKPTLRCRRKTTARTAAAVHYINSAAARNLENPAAAATLALRNGVFEFVNPHDDNNNNGGVLSKAAGKGNLCKICGKIYARPSTLKTHMRTHSGERPYQCAACLKTFTQAANLTAHARTHSGEKPFTCPICLRHFSQSSSVTTHLRTHNGDRPYKCQVCRKSFSDSSTLTKHMRTHSGEKPYKCQLCAMRFSQSGNLNRHMKIHLQQQHHTKARWNFAGLPMALAAAAAAAAAAAQASSAAQYHHVNREDKSRTVHNVVNRNVNSRTTSAVLLPQTTCDRGRSQAGSSGSDDNENSEQGSGNRSPVPNG